MNCGENTSFPVLPLQCSPLLPHRWHHVHHSCDGEPITGLTGHMPFIQARDRWGSEYTCGHISNVYNVINGGLSGNNNPVLKRESTLFLFIYLSGGVLKKFGKSLWESTKQIQLASWKVSTQINYTCTFSLLHTYKYEIITLLIIRQPNACLPGAHNSIYQGRPRWISYDICNCGSKGDFQSVL